MDDTDLVPIMAAIIMADGETGPKSALQLADEVAHRARHNLFDRCTLAETEEES